jgi:sarcosine oxidase/L-pipecolate oxidase
LTYLPDVERASRSGWAHKLDPCRRQERFGVHKAVLDSSAGFVVAYKACAWTQHLARKAGVEFILHHMKGKVVEISTAADQKPVVRTADGMTHEGDLVVVAGNDFPSFPPLFSSPLVLKCLSVINVKSLSAYLLTRSPGGGWTAGLLPEAAGLVETTAGSVATVQLPRDRPDLWERFAPGNFPVLTWGMKEGKDMYSFPRDENGVVKVGFRKTKWTNYGDVEGRRISVPKVGHGVDGKGENKTGEGEGDGDEEGIVPVIAVDAIKGKVYLGVVTT